MKDDLSSKVILLADDEIFSRDTIATILRQIGFSNVLQAQNGSEAIEVLRGDVRVDYIISDFKMPKINGLELLKAVRMDETGADPITPFAMLTGFSDRDIVDIALSLDVNAFLVKPVSRNAIVTRIKRLADTAQRDQNWLKPAEAYSKVSFDFLDIKYNQELTTARVSDRLSDMAEAAEQLGRSLREEKVVKIPKSSTPKASRSRPAPTPPKKVVEKFSKRLSSLNGRFTESDLAGQINNGLTKLIEDHGPNVAGELVDGFETLHSRGMVSLSDIAGALKPPKQGRKSQNTPDSSSDSVEELFFPLAEVPINSVLAREIKARDGHVFIQPGIAMTEMVLSGLQYLNHLDVLQPTDSDAGGSLGVYVYAENNQQGASSSATFIGKAPEISVSPEDLREGGALARDVFTAHGKMFATAGTALSGRVVSLISDMCELGHGPEQIWIIDDDKDRK